jgi:hypothetical protein
MDRCDTAYGSAANLEWLVKEKGISPHVPVIDKSKRDDGTFSREEFVYDKERDIYICPAGKTLKTSGRLVNGGATLLYLASTYDCGPCPLKSRCCPAIAATQGATRRDRKKVEMQFAHLKRILQLGRLRLRGPRGAQFEFTLAAIAQNLRRLGKLIARPPPAANAKCVA